MENLKGLGKLLSEIKKISEEIMQRSLPIMHLVKYPNDEYVIKLMEEIPELESEQALSTLQDITVGWVNDADHAKDEIDIFIIEETDSFRINVEGCPTLAEVWNGDAYDKAGIEGLREFRDDLKKQLSNIGEEQLMRQARVMLLGEEDE
jgi:hypothetical protein